MLKFHGHMFTDSALCKCCVGDKRMVVVDPTNTGKLRAKFRMVMGQHWNQLRELTRMMLNKQDLLALKSGGLMQVTAPAITGAGSKIDVFQRWFDLALENAVLQKDGSFMRRFLNEAYTIGTQFGQQQAKTQVTHNLSGHREGALQSLARVELQGIIEAVSQQAIRIVSNGLLTSQRPMQITRQVLNIIETIGRNRSNAMIELLVVRAHAEASLDIYEASGLKAVGLIPESRAQARVVTDAKAQQAAEDQTTDAKRSTSKRRKAGPGSRVPRTSVPSSRTISRIRAAELRIARALGENVNVRTAGDDDVCPVCEAISENGPYAINRARSLIPAHPHCRCVFVPASDARFGSEEALANSAIPREGSRKRAVYEAYITEGREAAFKKAEELGIKRTSAQSWVNTWKRGTPPDPFAPPSFPRVSTPAPAPLPPVLEGHGRRPALREIKITGTHKDRDRIEAAIGRVPQEHLDMLSRRGVYVRLVREIESKNGAGVLGRYSWNDTTGHIQVAEQYRIGGTAFAAKKPGSTVIHEIGHAIDHARGWRLNQVVSSQVEADAAAGMTKRDRDFAKYFFSNEKEKFAELYAAAYGTEGAFGMTSNRAKTVFAKSIELLKGIKL